MSTGRVEENTVKWICSEGEMTSPPFSLHPSLTQTNCAIFVSLALHHCLSKPRTLSSFSSLSPSPLPYCLFIKSLQYSISTFHICFNLLRISCPSQARNVYEGGHKRAQTTAQGPDLSCRYS